MPCTALARGIRQSAPHTSLLPFNDAINNNPCGKPVVQSVGGVNVAAESLCAFHWQFKHGQQDFVGPFVYEGGGAAYSGAVLADSPLLYWKLDEASGTAIADSSGNGRGGVATALAYGQPSGGLNLGTAPLFNGTSSKIASSAVLPLAGLGMITIEHWMKLTTPFNSGVSDRILFETSADASAINGAFLINPYQNAALYEVACRAVGSGQAAIRRYTSPPVGGWHHYVNVLDMRTATTRILTYIDGVLQTAASIPVANTAAGNFADFVLNMGARGGTGLFFPGLVDEVAIYAGELSAARVLAHYQAAAPVIALGEWGEGTDSSTIGTNNPNVTICGQKDAVLASPITRLDSIKVKVKCGSAFSLRASVYASPFGALLDYGPPVAFPATDGWISLPLSGAALAAGTYSLAVDTPTPGTNIFLYSTPDAVNVMRYAGGAFPATPATPFPTSLPLNFRLSMYAVGV